MYSLPKNVYRERIDFSKIKTTVPIPNLIEIQKKSYERFLQMDLLPSERDETGLEMEVCHFPPGTSKWNKIEHRLFSFVTQNWRGKPLVSHQAIVNLIASTTTKAGLSRLQARRAADDRGHGGPA